MDGGKGIIVICQVIIFLDLIREKFCLQVLLFQNLVHQLDDQLVG